MFRWFSGAFAKAPRKILISPHSQSELDSAGFGEWIASPLILRKHPVTAGERLSYFLIKWESYIKFRFNAANRGAIFPLLTNSAVIPVEQIRDVTSSLPTAIVCVIRCDNLNLIKLKTPGQTWIMDANDTVLNLFRTYIVSPTTRVLMGFRPATFLGMIRDEELRLARRFDHVVSISADDDAYYRSSSEKRCFFEDTCVVGESWPARRAPRFEIGFLGGNHPGTIQSAQNLIRLAASAEFGNTKFAIAGAVCDGLRKLGSSPNVEYCGRVSSTTDFYTECASLVLLSSGETGTSVKFQEAILSGAPVIANRNAARWSLASEGLDYFLASAGKDVGRLLSTNIAEAARRPFPDKFRFSALCTRLNEGLSLAELA